MNITVKQGQSVYDIALIAYGDPSAIYDLAKENPTIDISSISDLTGITLTYTQRKKSSVAEAVKAISVLPKVVTISSEQTVFDLALQYYGKAEYAYKLLAENPEIESILSDNIAGLNLIYTESKEFIPNYFKTNKLIIATRAKTKYLLQENGEFLLQENGEKIILEF